MAFDFEKGMANPLTSLGLSLVANTQNPGQAIQQGLQQGLAMKKQFDEENANKALSKAVMSGADPQEALSIYAEAGGDPMKGAQFISALSKGQSDNLPQGYRWNAQANQAELIPGVDPSYGTKQQMMITPYQQASLGLQAQGQMLNAQARQEAMTERKRMEAEKKAELGAQKYANQLEQSGLAEIKKQYDTAKGSIPSEGNIPGFGYGSPLVPDVIVGQKGREVRQDIAGLRNAILKARSGGAVTPQEADRLLGELGMGIGKDDAQLRRGIDNVGTWLNGRLSNLAAGVPIESIDLYQQRGGTILPPAQSAIPPSSAQPSGIKFLGFE